MIRRVLVAAAAPLVALLALGPVADRFATRLTRAPRHAPGEETMADRLDRLGGEIVRIRSRDGVRLSGRWLDAEPAAVGDADAGTAWLPDPREAVLLLHGYKGSIVPDLLEYGPLLRRTAGVLGLDFRGHGGSDDAPTTFGLHEIEDVAGALAWLGERGIARVALVGSSMGGITAIAAVAILGDGRLAGADIDADAPTAPSPTPRPRIVAVVGDSVTPELAVVVASRTRLPFGRLVAERAFARLADTVGDPRSVQPIAMIGLLEDVPLLLIHGTQDRTVPLADAMRLAAAAPPGARHVVIDGADHGAGHATDPGRYETEVTNVLRDAFAAAR